MFWQVTFIGTLSDLEWTQPRNRINFARAPLEQIWREYLQIFVSMFDGCPLLLNEHMSHDASFYLFSVKSWWLKLQSKGIIQKSIENQRKKTFPRPTTNPSLLTLKVIKHYPTALQRHLNFWRSLQRRWKFHTFICYFSFLHNKYLCVIEKSKKLNQQYTFILILKVCR